MTGHVFISYSHKDSDYVERLVAHLKSADIDVWTDEGVDYGQQWPGVIETKIESCAAFVPVMSVNSKDAAWVDREIDLAQELGKPILPLLLSGRRFLRLRNIQDEDVSSGQMPSVRFVDRLRTLTRTEAPPPGRAVVTMDAYDLPAGGGVARGFATVATLVRRTLGPLGRRVLVQTAAGEFVEVADSAAVTRHAHSQDTSEAIGVGYVRDLVANVRAEVGDGGATAVVLADAMLRRASAELRAGAHPAGLQRGIRAAVAAVAGHLAALARPIETKQQLAAVVALATDAAFGDIIAEAMDRVGRSGPITVEENNTFGLVLELTDGARLPRGHISAYFVTDPDRQEAVLDDSYILVANDRITEVADLLPVLEKVVTTGRPVLVIGEDIDGPALATLVVNKVKETLKSIAVRVDDPQLRQDIALLTGGQVVGAGTRRQLGDADLSALGRARRVITTQDETIIVDAAGDPRLVGAAADEVRAQLEKSRSEQQRDALRERLARLSGGVAVIRVGAGSEAEQVARKDLAERAVRMATAAARDGVVAGGGAALVATAAALRTAPGLPPDQEAGFRVVVESLATPFAELVRNAGHDPANVSAEMRAQPEGTAYDAVTGAFVPAVPATLADPVAVTTAAVRHAAETAIRYILIS